MEAERGPRAPASATTERLQAERGAQELLRWGRGQGLPKLIIRTILGPKQIIRIVLGARLSILIILGPKLMIIIILEPGLIIRISPSPS